jgi:hypothetical protein
MPVIEALDLHAALVADPEMVIEPGGRPVPGDAWADGGWLSGRSTLPRGVPEESP